MQVTITLLRRRLSRYIGRVVVCRPPPPEDVSVVPEALVTLRAHRSAPAHVELAYRPLPGRVARAAAALICCWGPIPLIAWIPPHYPWVLLAVVAGIYLSRRSFTGRYRVSYFAGICPRCGQPISLGLDRCISLPHTLTCYHCHFEPRLEVRFDPARPEGSPLPQHRTADCVGMWEVRWLADDPFVICNRCLAGSPATPAARVAADAENDRATLLARLAREGKRMM